jgi:hypothetical protein
MNVRNDRIYGSVSVMVSVNKSEDSDQNHDGVDAALLPLTEKRDRSSMQEPAKALAEAHVVLVTGVGGVGQRKPGVELLHVCNHLWDFVPGQIEQLGRNS